MVQNFSRKTLPRDLFTGAIIALVSIPISMGYAQIAGLPAACGLYGSIFPILIFGLLSGSPQFIFGVDAAPAALVGAFLVTQGIAPGSADAAALVPVITLLVGVWLLLFALLRAGRLAAYISTPVMGGFISGICATIILMQVPKLLGGSAGTGELPELLRHLILTCRSDFHAMSLLLGGAALTVLLLGRHFCPKLPMAVFVMAAGAAAGYFDFAAKYGIRTLEAVRPGLPSWALPDLTLLRTDTLSKLLTHSLTVAVVIMVETLLATGSFANKNGDKIRDNREIFVYGLCNLAACLTGCCPVNGSVSRTAMGEQYGGKSQVMSLAASASMACILLFFTGFIGFLPVPVLTAIVISALLGAIETDLAHRLFRQDRKELLIFLAACFGVLLFGTVAGVVIGVLLSFVSLIIKTANPKRSFLGVIPGHEGFHSLERNTFAVPVQNVILYRFASNLYFANVHLFVSDLEQAIKEDTKCIVVDTGAVCNLDITAADRIEALRRSLNSRGIALYFASHIGALNDRFRELGLGGWIENGYCRRTIPSALANAGFTAPYALENGESGAEEQPQSAGSPGRLEFEWAFGAASEAEMEKYTAGLLARIDENAAPEEQLAQILRASGVWRNVSDLDQEELLNHLEPHIRELAERLHLTEKQIEDAIEARRFKLAKRLVEQNPSVLRSVRLHRLQYEQQIQENDPALYARLIACRRESIAQLRKTHPEYAELIAAFYAETEEGGTFAHEGDRSDKLSHHRC